MRALRLLALLAPLLAAPVGLGGCKVDPYCLNCTDGSAGEGGPIDHDAFPLAGDMPTVAADLTSPPADLAVADLAKIPDGPLGPCGGGDAQFAVDPNNCGSCGTKCLYPHAAGLCVNAACTMGDCQPGYVDIDKMTSDGCEYACIPTNGGVEICDGVDNNCDGKIDEGFNLQTDNMNCGACGNICNFPNTSTTACLAGKCTVATCQAGYKDLNMDGMSGAGDGCEYKCPVFPTTAEVCNGLDDDCNGKIDDNPTDVGGSCDTTCPPLDPCVGAGTCTRPSTCKGACCGICAAGGTLLCASGQKLCQFTITPSLEVCDGVDNNCDGRIDEGFDTMTDAQNCGGCGKVCSQANAIMGCSGGACVRIACKQGFSDVNGLASDGCEYPCPVNPPTAETCNGKDDDCNGKIDDALKTPSNFCAQTGPCAGSTVVCGKSADGNTHWICNFSTLNQSNGCNTTTGLGCIAVDSAGNLSSSETLCDNFDNNCNGQKDETFPKVGTTCSAGSGRCAGAGTNKCSTDGKSTTCSAVANATAAIDEQCNGIDDDCDGVVDERTPVAGTQCFNGGQHNCAPLIDPMVKVTWLDASKASHTTYIDQYEAARPDATATVEGVSSGRACVNAGVLPWVSVSYTTAKAICAARVDSTGKAMRLCADLEWQAACNYTSTMTAPVWAYGTTPTVYQPTACNGYDKGLGTTWPTGNGGMACSTAGTNGRIYDLSGNVGEWLSDEVDVTDPNGNVSKYFRVHGGAFNTLKQGLACGFDFVIETASYANYDLGFRCCADNAP